MAYSPKTVDEYILNVIAYLVSRNSKITNFKVGSRIRTLVEAMALELAKIGYSFFSGYKEAIREACYESFDFERLPAEKAAGFIRFEYSGHTEDYIIPVFQISVNGLLYETITEVTLPVGQSVIDIDILSVEGGEVYNNDAFVIDTDEGKGNILEDFEFDRIYNPAQFTGGKDIETPTERNLRFKDFIKSFYRSTLNGIRYAVRTTPGVKDFFVYDNIDPITGQENPGWINVLLSDGTNAVSEGVIQSVRDKINGVVGNPELTGYRAGGTRLFVGKLLLQPINIFYEMEVIADSDFTDEILIQQANTAILNYVNGLKNGQNVLIETVRARGLTANPDIYTFRTPGQNSDIIVQNGFVPKIGGSGGGVIICNKVTRVVSR